MASKTMSQQSGNASVTVDFREILRPCIAQMLPVVPSKGDHTYHKSAV